MIKLEFQTTHTKLVAGLDPDSPEKIGERFVIFSVNDDFECYQIEQYYDNYDYSDLELYDACINNPNIDMYRLDYAIRYLEKHEKYDLIDRIKKTMEK